MLASDIPYKFQDLWAANAVAGFVTNPIPVTTSSPAASQSLGFPPATSQPIAAGGVPPNINDFNGVYQYITAWLQWVQAGGPIYYDATFQSNIGGYPAGARIRAASGLFDWLSLVDNNMTDPDTGGAGWQAEPPPVAGSLGAAGWMTLSGGLIVQWGGFGGTTGAASGAGVAEIAGIPISFPTTFPNAVYRVFAIADDVSGADLQETAWNSPGGLTTSGAAIGLSCRQAYTAMTGNYFVIGS